jgi:hypothetical protein
VHFVQTFLHFVHLFLTQTHQILMGFVSPGTTTMPDGNIATIPVMAFTSAAPPREGNGL